MLDTITLKPEGGEDDTWYHDDVDGEIDDRWQKLMVVVRMKLLKALSTAQKEAGNYKMQHIKFQGFDISIENPKGSLREGVNKTGKPWQRKMYFDYGYIRRTEGVDGDHVDVYVGPDEDAKYVYIVHQKKADTGEYDEDKCMLGFRSEAEAKQAYLMHYNKPGFFGAISAVPLEMFREKVFDKKGEPIVPNAARLVKKAIAAAVLLGVVEEVKHLPEKHDQKQHGRLSGRTDRQIIGDKIVESSFKKQAEKDIALSYERYNKDKSYSIVSEVDKRNFKEILDTGTPVVAVHASDLLTILSSGRLISASEDPYGASSSGAQTFSGKRRKWEQTKVGQKLPVEHSPIYGYLDSPFGDDEDKAVTKQYGSIVFVPKKEVRTRTTYTVGDSGPMGRQAFTPLTLDDHGYLFGASVRSSYSPLFGILGKTGGLGGTASSMYKPLMKLFGYIETQVHGGLTLDDIAEIRFPIGTSSKLLNAVRSKYPRIRLGTYSYKRTKSVEIDKHLPERHNQQDHAGDARGHYQATLDYTNKNHVLVNALLRGQHNPSDPDSEGPKEVMEARKTIDELDAAFAESDPIENDVTVWRGVKQTSFLNDMKVGDTFIEPAYLSTSGEEKLGLGFTNAGGLLIEPNRALWQIEVPKGYKALRGTRRGEDELILPRDTQLRLTHKTRLSGIPLYVFDVVIKHLPEQHNQKAHGISRGMAEGISVDEDVQVIRQGEVVSTSKGVGSRATLDVQPGDELVHTHPGGSTLSYDDLVAAAQGELRAIHAVTSYGMMYSFLPPEGQKLFSSSSILANAKSVEKLFMDARKILLDAMIAGTLPKQTASQPGGFGREVWKMVGREHPDLFRYIEGPIEKHLAERHNQKAHGRYKGGHASFRGAIPNDEKGSKKEASDWGREVNRYGRTVFSKEKYNELMYGLSDLGEYVQNSHFHVNGLLRGQIKLDPSMPSYGDTKRMIKGIDGLMEAGRTHQAVTTWRGVDRLFFEKLKPGKTFVDKGFVSTSLTQEVIDPQVLSVSAPFEAVLEIEVPHSVPAWYVGTVGAGYHANEFELLLRRGLKFEVISVSKPKLIKPEYTDSERWARMDTVDKEKYLNVWPRAKLKVISW